MATDRSPDVKKINDNHLEQSKRISDIIDEAIDSLSRANRLGNEKKIKLLAQLVRAQAELVRTQRTVTGLDQVQSTINAGVIIIPGKASEGDWHSQALGEIENAKHLVIEASQVNHERHPLDQKRGEEE